MFLQFLRFGAVGSIGFVIDTATVYALRIPIGLLWAGAVAYIVAASGNWALNRIWTFRASPPAPARRQWTLYMLANLVGFILNRGTYAGLILTTPLFTTWPVLAVAAGAGAGMLVNFFLSRLVFDANRKKGQGSALDPPKAEPLETHT